MNKYDDDYISNNFGKKNLRLPYFVKQLHLRPFSQLAIRKIRGYEMFIILWAINPRKQIRKISYRSILMTVLVMSGQMGFRGPQIDRILNIQFCFLNEN